MMEMDRDEAVKKLLRAMDGLRDDLYGISVVLEELLTVVTELKASNLHEDGIDDSKWFVDPDERSE